MHSTHRSKSSTHRSLPWRTSSELCRKPSALLREALSRMNGGADAADIAENIQTLLARLQGDVARFATLKLAAAVLDRGIERYREQNQGPILARASELFASLDRGLFHPPPD